MRTQDEGRSPECDCRGCPERNRLRTERDTMRETLRMIAEKKRRTKEQRLANSCLMFLESIDSQPAEGEKG